MGVRSLGEAPRIPLSEPRSSARERALELMAERDALSNAIAELDKKIASALRVGAISYNSGYDWACHYCHKRGGGNCDVCSLYIDGSSPPSGLTPGTWQQIDRSSPDGCWPWMGSTSKGYALVHKHDGENRGHRVMYMIANPDADISGRVVHHTCRVKHCMNPEHLEAITKAEHGKRHYREANP